MRALMLEVPEKLLEERRRRGHDRFDEVWNGVLHMVPFPADAHQRFVSKLIMVLGPIAESRGLVLTHETGLFLADDDYRGPDVVVTREKHRTSRGVEGGAELVIEALSPDDESFEKLPFYERFGVKEALYVDPLTRAFTFYTRRRGRLKPKGTDKRGRVACKALDVTFAKIRGPKLEIAWADGSATI